MVGLLICCRCCNTISITCLTDSVSAKYSLSYPGFAIDNSNFLVMDRFKLPISSSDSGDKPRWRRDFKGLDQVVRDPFPPLTAQTKSVLGGLGQQRFQQFRAFFSQRPTDLLPAGPIELWTTTEKGSERDYPTFENRPSIAGRGRRRQGWGPKNEATTTPEAQLYGWG